MNHSLKLFLVLSINLAICLYVSSLDAADLFVISYLENNIYNFKSDGSRSLFASDLNRAYDLTFDTSGNLYETDLGSGNIFKFKPDGSQTTFASGLNYPGSLTFDSVGNLLVGDNDGNIYKFAPDGSKSLFVNIGPYFIGSLAFDKSGNLFAVATFNYYIIKIEPNGNYTLFDSVPNYYYLTPDADGNLYAADYHDTIFKYSPDGTKSTFASNLSFPEKLAFDDNGNLFCGECGSGVISIISPNGSRSIFADGLLMPVGLAFAPTIPEPSTLALLGIGGFGFLAWAWRRHAKRPNLIPQVA